ncbi:MAG: hypothetical protein JWM95_4957 [Gemmatimonadetes bacterium]|nr:hypothetical protein [Gemmatimonadota bacterium]
MTQAHPAPRSEAELEECISRPSASLATRLGGAPGDVIILGAGGKMGPSLTRMMKRAGPARRVMAVSRWSDAGAANALRNDGVEIIQADLLDARALAALPDAPNVVFMAGQKFGTAGNPATTWAMNAAVPAFVAERYAGSRTVVFSTGNVYPLTRASGGGSRETDEPAPIGEYAYSCLARERIFAAAAARHGTPVAIVRLNYAHDLRYGVLTDLATRIVRRESVDLCMSYVNVIWQGDANAIALSLLPLAQTMPPHIVNVAGPQLLRIADVAHALGTRLHVDPVFTGDETPDALLSNTSHMRELFTDPLLPLDVLLDWVASWVLQGGRLLGKPTQFEKRDGTF